MVEIRGNNVIIDINVRGPVCMRMRPATVIGFDRHGMWANSAARGPFGFVTRTSARLSYVELIRLSIHVAGIIVKAFVPWWKRQPAEPIITIAAVQIDDGSDPSCGGDPVSD
jgi:hypothetical protein